MSNIKFVIYHVGEKHYNHGSDIGYFCGIYRYQGDQFGAFYRTMKNALNSRLKTYTSKKRAENARLKVVAQEVNVKNLEIYKVDLETFEVLEKYSYE